MKTIDLGFNPFSIHAKNRVEYSGLTNPNPKLTVTLSPSVSQKITAGKNGTWSYLLDSSTLKLIHEEYSPPSSSPTPSPAYNQILLT